MFTRQTRTLNFIIYFREQNLMDYFFSLMENNALVLEKEVNERMIEFVQEKKKSDILLYKMLPKTVADRLKNGQTVEPELFQAATVFFSDVVSFTTLAGRSTPLQVCIFFIKIFIFDCLTIINKFFL